MPLAHIVREMTPTQEAATRPNVLAEFLGMLASAGAVSIDNGALMVRWTVADTTGEAANQVARFGWLNATRSYTCTLTEGGIAAGHFEQDGTFVCEDHEGCRTEVRLFYLQQCLPEQSKLAVLDRMIDSLAEGASATTAARAALVALRNDVLEHDRHLALREECPTGGDYNWLVERLGVV